VSNPEHVIRDQAVRQATSTRHHTLTPEQRERESFYLWIAVALGCTVFVGFWFTYFGPLFRGIYPQVSPLVHVHGWTFFGWYVLLIAQASLIRSGRVAIHRALGLASTVLATVMIAVGLIVSTVRIDMSLGPDGDPFWALMGLPIFSIWVLFTVFYAAAIYRRRRAADHKRLMLLASAVALSAATFRIFVEIFGLERWVAIVGTLAPNFFMVGAMIYDYRSVRQIHRMYLWGVPTMLGAVGGVFLLGMTPAGEVVKQAVAWFGRLLRPLY
jgi:uncharacterized membrane protein YozB (DUF420 family)